MTTDLVIVKEEKIIDNAVESSDLTPIYNAVALLRNEFAKFTGNNEYVSAFFEQHASVIIRGAANIFDDRNTLIAQLSSMADKVDHDEPVEQ